MERLPGEGKPRSKKCEHMRQIQCCKDCSPESYAKVLERTRIQNKLKREQRQNKVKATSVS